MLPPVRCFTCGALVADKAAAYRARLAQREAAAAPGGEAAAPPGESEFMRRFFSGPRMDDVFAELGVRRVCCRRMLAGCVDLCDLLA